MKIRYTRHARQRMAQRNIRDEQVSETLESPDEILQGDRLEMIAVRAYGVREIRIVYEEADEDTIIIYTVIQSRIRQA